MSPGAKGRRSVVSEITPLLDRDCKCKGPPEEIPKFQILLLCFARVTEPIAFFCIFPYIAEMVQRNGNMATSDVGFYSGLIESLFSASQAVVLGGFGTCSDRVGRKTMLLVSLVGMTLGTVMFGMSTSLWQMIVFRTFTGMFSGANLMIRTMILEQSTPTTRATTLSWYSIANSLGVCIGTMLGGVLVHPASQYSSLFGGIQFFEAYPYALPGFVVGTISATAAISSALFLDETLKKEVGEVDSEDAPGVKQKIPRPSMCQLLRKPRIRDAFLVYAYVTLLSTAFSAMVPVVLYTPVNVGGMGFSTTEIACYITGVGISEALWLMLAFPLLQRRLGTRKVLVICSYGRPIFYVMHILMNALLRQGDGAAYIIFLITASLNVLVGHGTWMSFTAAQLALNEASPGPDTLGKVNSLAEISYSTIRTIVPGITTALFAIGIREQILHGYISFVVLVSLSCGLPFIIR